MKIFPDRVRKYLDYVWMVVAVTCLLGYPVYHLVSQGEFSLWSVCQFIADFIGGGMILAAIYIFVWTLWLALFDKGDDGKSFRGCFMVYIICFAIGGIIAICSRSFHEDRKIHSVVSSPVGDKGGASEGSVFICTGRYAKRYHSSPYCNGLGSCSDEIVSMPLDEAEESGKTPCLLCH